MWIFHLVLDGEEGPEDRYVGPFSSQEDLETFIEDHDLDDFADWYVQIIPPAMLIKEVAVIQWVD